MEHRDWMLKALQLARGVEGLTRPNPPVGAVLVKNGCIIAEGAHKGAGQPHAEVDAINKVGRKARGSTLYVTLEPCSTHGRTGPCTDAITSAGIKMVVAAVKDPNPKHAGRGFRILRRRGVKVVTGICRSEAEELLEPFATWMLKKRPMITLKLAMTLDGRIADHTGKSKWISGPAARNVVQDLRRQSDAIMVGARTVALDNPSLVPRPARGRQPFRIILDSKGEAPTDACVFTDGHANRTLLVTSRRMAVAQKILYGARGAEVLAFPSGDNGKFLAKLMKQFHSMGLLRILCEGGGLLAGALVAGGWVDEYIFFVAPAFLGERAVPALGHVYWNLEKAPRLSIRDVCTCGKDVVIRARPA